jgi:hypothetical protein
MPEKEKGPQQEYLQRQFEEAKAAQMKEGPSFEINGILERDKMRRYVVNGEEIVIGSFTDVQGGTLKEGSPVHVVGKIKSGQKLAEQVLVQTLNKNDNSSENSSALLGH